MKYVEIVYLSNRAIQVAEVFEELLDTGFDLILGPDLVSPLFLHIRRYSLTNQIHYFFSLSLNSSVFPSKWKLSFLTSLRKAGVKSLVDNYRPIPELITKTYRAKVIRIRINSLSTFR